MHGTPCVFGASRGQEDFASSGTAVRDAWELPRECWELNRGPKKEDQVLSATEPSLQLPLRTFF